jgi:hypothetical protein
MWFVGLLVGMYNTVITNRTIESNNRKIELKHKYEINRIKREHNQAINEMKLKMLKLEKFNSSVIPPVPLGVHTKTFDITRMM